MTRPRRKQIVIHRGKRAAPMPPTVRPLDAAVMTIDSAKTSGIATYLRGRLWAYAECNARDPRDRLRCLSDLVTTATVRGLAYAVAVEVPWGGYQAAALSLHATAALWRDSWLQLGQPADRMLERTASDWRKLLFGKAQMPRDLVRRVELEFAHKVAERDLRTLPRAIGPDAAAAICIGQVMIRSRDLQQTLGCELVP